MGEASALPGALLFDLDGTLIRSDPLHLAVFAEVLAPFGVTVTEDLFSDKIHGRANDLIFSDLAPGADAQALSDAKEREFRRRLGGEAEPVEGAAELIEAATRQGVPCAVVTNAPRANAEAMLEAIGLSGRFATVIAEGDAARSKPDPAPYHEAMRRLGVTPKRSVAFEDSPAGVRAAVASGALTVGLCSSLDDAALRTLGATFSISDFKEIALHELLRRRQSGAAA